MSENEISDERLREIANFVYVDDIDRADIARELLALRREVRAARDLIGGCVTTRHAELRDAYDEARAASERDGF